MTHALAVSVGQLTSELGVGFVHPVGGAGMPTPAGPTGFQPCRAKSQRKTGVVPVNPADTLHRSPHSSAGLLVKSGVLLVLWLNGTCKSGKWKWKPVDGQDGLIGHLLLSCGCTLE